MTSPVIGQIPDLEALLQHAGAKPARYGKRWDCPTCAKPGHVSVDFGRGLFHCWHAGCNFKGSTFTLARSLGFASPTPEQAQTFRREREKAGEAARLFAERLRTRRFELCRAHRDLLSILYGAHSRLRTNPQDEIAWSALRFVYEQFPPVRAELLLLESAPISERLAFMQYSPPDQSARLQRIVEHGGLISHDGRFLEIGDPAHIALHAIPAGGRSEQASDREMAAQFLDESEINSRRP